MNKIVKALLVFLAMLILQYALQDEPAKSPNEDNNATGKPVAVNAIKVSGAVTPSEASEDSRDGVTNPEQFYGVVEVVDGDTIAVDINGEKIKVRLIGINSPETVDPRKRVECFGKEASAAAKNLLSGKKVRLEADPSQMDRDKYGRLLRYVFLEDGTNVNELLVARGYAYEYTYDLPYKYQKEFRAAQKFAEANKRGLWGKCADKLN
jgi:micrococcal nuclease